MKKSTYGLVILALVLAATAPAPAQLGELDELARLGGNSHLSALVKEALTGRAPEGIRVEKMGGGLTKVAIPLREDSPLRRQKMGKDLINIAITIELFEPDFFASILSFDVVPLDQTDYYIGWMTANVSDRDIDAKSVVKTKGPGPDFSLNQILTYDASSFVLFFVQFSGGWDQGFHSVDAKVQGAKPGKLKGNFCADCL